MIAGRDDGGVRRRQKRELWDPPCWQRTRDATPIVTATVAFLLAAILFVSGIQPVVLRVAGRVVGALGGSFGAALVLVLGIYAGAGAGLLFLRRRIGAHGFRQPTVIASIAVIPLAITALALTPPRVRDPQRSETLAGFVGDDGVARSIEDAMFVGIALALAVGAVLVARRQLLDREAIDPRRDRPRW